MRKLLVALGGLFLCLAANAQNTAVGSLTASGADCTTAGACITLQFEGNDVASASIQLSGTFTATVQFEASSDKGTTWVAISGTPLNSSAAVTSATTANTWKFNVASITNIRARCSAFTSAPTVVIRSSRAVANAIGSAVYASGSGTSNVIPKGNGSGQLADSSITDNATILATSEPVFQFAEGTCSGAAANKDALCANSTSHNFQGSFNNGSFFVLPSWVTGGVTTNTIPKTSGTTGQLADSAVTDNATNVTSTEALLLPDGTAALPAYSFTSDTGFGWYRSSSGHMTLATTGSVVSVDLNASANAVKISSTAGYTWTSANAIGTADTQLGRVGAASIRAGFANNATPVANTLTIGESSRGGTDTNIAGASGTIAPGVGTGLGAATKLCLQRDLMGATGSTAQNQRDGYCVGPSKTLSNTTATAQSLVNISVPSNSAGGVEGTITVTCTDGTNFDSETQSFNTSFVNKATVLTVTAPVITATTAANNSGSCTAGITAVAGTNSVDIKVTPVFTTIVPTTVTSYITLRNNGTGNATFN